MARAAGRGRGGRGSCGGTRQYDGKGPRRAASPKRRKRK